MSSQAIKTWSWLHKWTSLVCTVFMLLLCITGLPLIFHHEIGHLLGQETEAPEMPATAPRASMDVVMKTALDRYPGKAPLFASQEPDDDRIWYVTLSNALGSEQGMKQVAVDARTGLALGEPKLEGTFMHVMFSLHVDMFAGQPGKLFLGFMGLLLLIAIVSGVVLYAPFMRKLQFGEVRRDRSARVKWLDMHNLLGIVTLTWALVVGATGVINTWADLLMRYWQTDQMAQMVAPYKDKPPLTQLGSLEKAVQAAVKAEPDMRLRFVAFPGTFFTSPHHYGVYLRGTEPVSARLIKPVLVDATTGEITDSREMPWYLTALFLSQPLHFGDYGGSPMQVIWAILDIMTIIVLGSGLYLWWVRRSPAAAADTRAGAKDVQP
ncbi:MAG: PepSY domain-containing protein [Comamonadaceae bacterium]|nr:MAG: PepSY domain-containing protein [Comamonadaceae bacterium]